MGHDIQRETRRATAHLEREAFTDPLTGLDNRRAMNQWLGEVLDPRRRDRRTITAIAIDLDRFKPINDKLGHEAGDHCLRFLGQLLKSNLRDGACAIRLGGDEFVVLMPDQGNDVGRVVAERLKRLFAQMPWPHSNVPRPTFSVGVASIRGGQPDSAAELLRQADEALYSSKQSGRSMVTEYGERRGAA
jgi:diguanylate cyclase (GGDEF)-like protein